MQVAPEPPPEPLEVALLSEECAAAHLALPSMTTCTFLRGGREAYAPLRARLVAVAQRNPWLLATLVKRTQQGPASRWREGRLALRYAPAPTRAEVEAAVDARLWHEQPAGWLGAGRPRQKTPRVYHRLLDRSRARL